MFGIYDTYPKRGDSAEARQSGNASGGVEEARPGAIFSDPEFPALGERAALCHAPEESFYTGQSIS
jgi:hypothetical protein